MSERTPPPTARPTRRRRAGDRMADRWVALFLLGGVAFMSPLLGVFSTSATLFGLPLLFFYLFAVWAGLILLAARLVRRGGGNDAGGPDGEG